MKNDPYTRILDAYFWHFVDQGNVPHDTPLFCGTHEGDSLVGLSRGNSTFRRTRPNPPSKLPGRRSRYEPRHLSGDHRAVHRAAEARNRAVAEALVCCSEHRLAETLPRNQCPASRLDGLPIPVLDQLQTGARPWRPRKEGREIHAGHLLQDPRKAGRSREGGAARGRQARSHSVRPVGECFQSRPDRGHPGPRDHGHPEHVTASRKGGCHRRECEALPDSPRGIRCLLLAPG